MTLVIVLYLCMGAHTMDFSGGMKREKNQAQMRNNQTLQRAGPDFPFAPEFNSVQSLIS